MQVKKCKHIGGCPNYPKMGFGGYCYLHEKEDAAYERKLKEKERKTAAKNLAQKLRKEENPKALGKGVDAELERWFADRRKEMTGKCLFCNGNTTKDNDKWFKASIGHLLPKRANQFPSVAKHKDNWIELCFYGKSCHTNFDNSMITLEDVKNTMPKAWDVIVSKFLKVYPRIAENEKKNIPQILLDFI